MGKRDDYKKALQALPEWDDFLLRKSGLPGTRGNIELAQAAADLAAVHRIERWLKWNPEKAPVNSKEEFLAFCGVLGLGRLAAECRVKAPVLLRKYASDPRWRMREGVAMAMQRRPRPDAAHHGGLGDRQAARAEGRVRRALRTGAVEGWANRPPGARHAGPRE